MKTAFAVVAMLGAGVGAILMASPPATANSGSPAVADVSVGSGLTAAYGTPQMDATLDSVWNSTTAYDFNSVGISDASSSPISATTRFLWDTKNVYVLTVVNDDTPYANDPTANGGGLCHLNVYNDAVDVWVGWTGAADASYTSSAGTGVGVTRSGLVYENGNPCEATSTDLSTIKTDVVSTSTGYVVEDAIPWPSSISRTGSPIAINVSVNDVSADNNHRTSWITMDTGEDYWDQPPTTPTLEFTGNNDGRIFEDVDTVDMAKGQVSELPIWPEIVRAGGITYSVSGSAVSVDSATGRVTAIAPGTATVTASAPGYADDHLTIDVASPGTLTASQSSITSGDSVSFDYALPFANSSDHVAWYPADADPLTSQPLNAFSQPAPGATGTVSFDTTGLESGDYDVYVISSNSALLSNPATVAVTNYGPELPSPGQLPGRPNLLVNGGAELGSATLTGTQRTSVPGWQVKGTVNEVQYDAAGAYPEFSSPGSADRGQNFFAAAGGGTSTASQTIDVSQAVNQINQGKVKYNLGGWLGGAAAEADQATLTATFLDASGHPLKTAVLQPVTAAQRSDTTGLLPENATGTLPRTTAGVLATLTISGAAGHGYADNLSFTISAAAVPAPPLPELPAPQTPASVNTAGRPNLLVNGNAEIGDGSWDGPAATTVPGWTVTGLLSETRYGAVSDRDSVPDWPTPSTPGPSDRGDNFFAGSGGGVSTGTQLADLSKASHDIDEGNVSYDLSGWLGGTGSVPDNAVVTATFLSAHGATLGTATLGPVTPDMRDNTTELLHEDATGTLPKGTRSVKTVLTVTGDHPASRSGHGQGYADDLSFTITSDRVSAPAAPVQPASTVPGYDHVFMVMMENEDYGEIVGNTAKAPYLNSLLPQGANLTSMYALAHPSDENYTALAAGTMSHQTGNTTVAENPVQHIGDLVGNDGGTWRAYNQSAVGPCDMGSQNTYSIDDTPFHNFKDVSDNQPSCQEHEQPLTQMATDLKSAATTPNFAWFSANDCDSMEGCGITAGDTWLSQTLPEIFNSPAWTQQRSLLIITFDEDAADGQANLQNIPTLILGSQGSVKTGSTSSTRYTLYSLTRTIESALHLPALTGNDYYANPVSGIWTNPANPTSR